MALDTGKPWPSSRATRDRIAALVLATLITGVCHGAIAEEAGHAEFFERRVRPLLVERCGKCHGDVPEPKGNLRLITRESLLQGGERGPAIVPGDPPASLLIQAIQQAPDAELKMPPNGRLSDGQIADLEQWVRDGAVWPAASPPGAGAPANWQFRPVEPPVVPEVQDPNWPANEVDRFVLAKLEAAGLAPAPPADKRTLLRRVYFDLIGLPPSPAEVEAFLADESPEAFARVVDRLLASPRYGERWGRHWLDVVRYAETNGQDIDRNKPNAWRFRDYVIRAFNDDVPFDTFVREQLAGDLLEQPRLSPDGRTRLSPLASAFYWLGEYQNMPVDMAVAEAAELEGQIDAFGKAFLGLTLACARCHDHKFDPLTMADYYGLGGFFVSCTNAIACTDTPETTAQIAATAERLKGNQAEIERLLATARVELVADELARLPDYVLACQELGLGEEEPDAADCQQVAARRGLDVARLQRWREFLMAASADKDPIWYPLAALASTKPDAFKPTALALYWRLVDWQPPDPQATGLEPLHLFEGQDYGDWTVVGQAFGAGPRRDAPIDWSQPGEQGYASSAGVDALTGRLTSPPFRVTKRFLSMYVAGGRFPFQACVNVKFHSPLVQEADDYTATGNGSEQFELRTMDVQPFVGRQAIIELVDQVRTNGGHIAATGFFISDEPPKIEFPPNMLVADLLWPEDVKSYPELLQRLAQLLGDVLGQWKQALAASGDQPPRRLLRPERDALRRWALTRGGLLDSGADPADKLLPEQRSHLEVLRAERQQLETEMPESTLALVAKDHLPRNLHIQRVGNPHHEGPEIPRGFPAVLTGGAAPPAVTGSGRLQLADWVASRDNPLTARVMVNRVWLHHFGRGIVATPNNFGALGEPPTHPELLDYLATRFVAEGWSIKALHRLLLATRTYQQAADASEAARAIDPDNKLYAHARVRRLDAECVRDELLAVAGNLNDQMYGPSVPLHVTKYMRGEDLDLPKFSGPMDGDCRRSIYLEVRRNHLTPLLAAFDFPKPDASIGLRPMSTVPGQALAMLNNEFVHHEARVWAERLLREPEGIAARIDRMFAEALARGPTAEERTALAQFVEQQLAARRDDSQPPGDDGTAEVRAWTAACHAVFNLAEFVFVE
ncbi:MAG: PSD1 and planctomycete cytochrome C domain-containing protein [Pirellulales bacterium]|nr:PSD1 and planctomycete cytochrome C domain-containing protein [Pirellulales bacterium]